MISIPVDSYDTFTHILHIITRAESEYQSDGSTKDTPYLVLTGELWGVFYECLWENLLQRYNGTALYKKSEAMYHNFTFRKFNLDGS